MSSSPSEKEKGWSERTNLQVQKMEATIEQDLSKAMAGIREQFRHQFDVDRPAPTNELEAAQRVVADRQAAGENGIEDVDEVLGGLAQLRQDLEAERARQSSPSRAGIADQMRTAAATDSSFADVRRDLLQQQQELANLRRDMTLQQEHAQVRFGAFDQTVTQMAEELTAFCLSSKQPSDLGNGDVGAFGQAINQDVEAIMRRCEHVEQFSQNIAEAVAAKLEQIEARVATSGDDECAQPSEDRRNDYVDSIAKQVVEEHGRESEKLRIDMEQMRRELVRSVDELREHVFGEIGMLRVRLQSHAEDGIVDGERFAEVSAGDVDRNMRMVQELGQDVEAALDALRRDVQESMDAHVSSTTSSLRGHVSVGCAEVRGELTARLDAYESSLQQTKSELHSLRELPCREESDMICNRLEAVEGDLHEVIQLAKLLATRFDEMKGRAAQCEIPVESENAEQQIPKSSDAEVSSSPQVSNKASTMTGDLKQSLEKLVEEVGAKLRPEEPTQSFADSDRDRDSLLAGPSLSYTSDSQCPVLPGMQCVIPKPIMGSIGGSARFSRRMVPTMGGGAQIEALLREQISDALYRRDTATISSPLIGSPAKQPPSVSGSHSLNSPRSSAEVGIQLPTKVPDGIHHSSSASARFLSISGRSSGAHTPGFKLLAHGYMPSRSQQGIGTHPDAPVSPLANKQPIGLANPGAPRTLSPVPGTRLIATQRAVSPVRRQGQGSLRRVSSPVRLQATSTSVQRQTDPCQ